MGNCLDKTPSTPPDTSLLIQLKQRSLNDLLECITVLTEDYPDHQCINYDQFIDIFDPLVDDPEPFFLLLQNEHDINGVVDVYEALGVFAIFSKEKPERKAAFIFELFDFDHSKQLELSEFVLTLQAVSRGLCKFVNITPPTRKSLEEDAISVFKLVDRTCDGKISITEFLLYIKHNPELQEFLLKYAGVQTLENLKGRFDKIYIEYLSLYDRAIESDGVICANAETLKQFIEEREKLVKKSDIEFLIEILLNTSVTFSRGGITKSEGLISKEAYEPIIRAWCAFGASDFDHNNVLVVPELHALLWLNEGKEPSEERVNFEMGELKKGVNGILLEDWMRNMCVVDNHGNYGLRPTLKKLFEKYDKDGSGYLSFDELKAIIDESFKGYAIRSNDEKVRRDIDEIVKSLTKEVFRELDANGSTSIAWEEFKKFMEVSHTKIDKLRHFLDVNLE